jgi:hypothetical protein
MRRWLKRLALIGAAGAIAGVIIRQRRRPGFDPQRPAHDWGTASLTIDG